MAVTIGNEQFKYRVAENWAKLPDGWSFREVAAVAVDKRDNVYCFTRGEHPVIVFDREGNFLRSWGEGRFKRAHGLYMAPDESLFLTDDANHTVTKATLDGRVLLELGMGGGRGAAYMSGEPFNRCTHTALSPTGEIYVSDGYGNARVHKYSPDGNLILSWGESGTLPGQFNIVHNICCDKDGWVYVADRENHRVQVFDGNGKYETQWNNLHRPCGMFLQDGPEPLFFIGELGPAMPVNLEAPNIGPRITITSKEGKILALLGDVHGGLAPGQFLGPHSVAVDSHGDIYVGEVSWTLWPTLFPQTPQRPANLRSLQKLVKVS